LGLKDPQEFAGVQLHITPLFFGSLITFADIFAEFPTIIVAGGGEEKAIVIGCGLEFDEFPLPQPARQMNVNIKKVQLLKLMNAPLVSKERLMIYANGRLQSKKQKRKVAD